MAKTRESGDPVEEYLPAVYDELRRLAGAYLARERPDHTLQATALVNEAYLRLAAAQNLDVRGRDHFFAIAARAMRRVLVDHARARGRDKRADRAGKVTLTDGIGRADTRDVDIAELIDLDSALRRLTELDERQARVVELRFFAGLTVEDIARTLGVSKRTAEGDWAHARAWLRRELEGSGSR